MSNLTDAAPVRHWWFGDKSTAELARQVAKAGPGYRLEVEPNGKDGRCWLHVIPAGHTRASAEAAGFPPINDSHPCPPDC